MDVNNGGSGIDYGRTLDRVSALVSREKILTIIPGHFATPAIPADFTEFSAFVKEFVAFVQNAKTAGKTVDDVVNTWKTPEKYASYFSVTANRLRPDVQVVWDETK